MCLPSLGICQHLYKRRVSTGKSGINRHHTLTGPSPWYKLRVLKQHWLALEPLELIKPPPEISTTAKFITTNSKMSYPSGIKWNFANKHDAGWLGVQRTGSKAFCYISFQSSISLLDTLAPRAGKGETLCCVNHCRNKSLFSGIHPQQLCCVNKSSTKSSSTASTADTAGALKIHIT